MRVWQQNLMNLKSIRKILFENKLKNVNDKLEIKKGFYNKQCKYLSNNEKIKDGHKLIDETIKEKKERFLLLNERKAYLKEWEKLFLETQNLGKKLLDHEENKGHLIKDIESSDEKEKESKAKYEEIKQNLENLNSASEAVQNAVSDIRKHLHKSQINCPVCQAEYSHEELTKRIEKSLSSMNPMITDAIIRERSAYDEWQKNLKERVDSINKLSDIIGKIKTIKDEIVNNKNRIDYIRLTYYQGSEDPKEAEEYLEKECEEISKTLKELDNEKCLMKKEVDIKYANKVNLDKIENERVIKVLYKEVNGLANDIDCEENKIVNLENELNGVNEDDISVKKELSKIEVDIAESKLAEAKRNLIQTKEKINQLKSRILDEEELISNMEMQLRVVADFISVPDFLDNSAGKFLS